MWRPMVGREVIEEVVDGVVGGGGLAYECGHPDGVWCVSLVPLAHHPSQHGQGSCKFCYPWTMVERVSGAPTNQSLPLMCRPMVGRDVVEEVVDSVVGGLACECV